MLVGSLTLSIGLAIYDLTVREIELSAAASQSQFAIYAADTGAECALYWDSKATPLGGAPSIFASSSASQSFSGTANCNGANIVVTGPPAAFLPAYLTATNPNSNCADSTHWCTAKTATAATTTFSVSVPSGSAVQTYCAVVQIGKNTVGGILYTTVISKGYNNCNPTGPARIERTLRVSY